MCRLSLANDRILQSAVVDFVEISAVKMQIHNFGSQQSFRERSYVNFNGFGAPAWTLPQKFKRSLAHTHANRWLHFGGMKGSFSWKAKYEKLKTIGHCALR